MQGNRPLIVTIICILTVAAVALFIFLESLFPSIYSTITKLPGSGAAAFGTGALISVYGLWNGQQWAWKIYNLFLWIGIVFGVLSLLLGDVASIVELIINVVVLRYMNMGNVKEFFNIK